MENKTQEVTDLSIKLEISETPQRQNDLLQNGPIENSRNKELTDLDSQLKTPLDITVKLEPFTSRDDEINPESPKVNYKVQVVDQHTYHVKEELHQNFFHDNSKYPTPVKENMYKQDSEWKVSVSVQHYQNFIQATLTKNKNKYMNDQISLESDEKSLLVESALKPSAQKKTTQLEDIDVQMYQRPLIKRNSTKEKSYLDSDQYTCYICRKKFKNYENMRKHRRRLHGAVKSHACEDCGKAFATLEYLKRHVLKHRGVKAFSCNHCSKSFYEKGNLRKHMVDKHINLKPHECSECSKKFNHKSELSRHMVVHTGYLKYKCTICFKKFSQSGYLNCHMMIHTGLTPYECPICSEKFPIKNYLTKHMLRHTTERPFECKVCKKKFKEKRGLDRHVVIHEDKKPLTCLVCGLGFSQKGHMSRHITKYHQVTCSFHAPCTETKETIMLAPV